MSVKPWLWGTACLCALSLPIATAQESSPLSFDQTVELATESPAVQLAESQLEVAHQQLQAASGVVSANLSADYTQSYIPASEQSAATSAGDFGAVTAEANLNVVPYGDGADAVILAEGDVEEAERTLEDARENAVVEAIEQYLDALRYSQEEKYYQAAVSVAEMALAATQTQLEAGAASDADILEAEISLSEAQNDLAEVALEQDQALATLAQTLNVSVSNVSGEPPSVTLPELNETDELLASRSDIASASLAIQEAELTIAASVRETLPSGSVSAGYSSAGVTVGAGIGTETYQPSLSVAYDPDGSTMESVNGFSAQVSVSIPLESGSGATLAAAKTSLENAQRQFDQIRSQAKLELQAAQNQLTTAQNSLASAEALVEQRRQSLETARTREELGLVAAYEVESAKTSLLSVEVDLARLQDSVLLAQLSLLRALSLDPMEVL